MYALKTFPIGVMTDFSFEKITFSSFILTKTLYNEKIKCYNGIRAWAFYK